MKSDVKCRYYVNRLVYTLVWGRPVFWGKGVEGKSLLHFLPIHQSFPYII